MTTDAPNGAPQQGPSMTALVQYVKDFSFENPNAPAVFGGQQEAPQISLQVNVGAQQVGESEFESVLTLEGKAQVGAQVLFAFELAYAGVFRIVGVPQDNLSAVVMIEAPRLLFPFARQIVGDAVRNGGFPPLYIDPIDFVALFQQRAAEAGQAPAGAALS